MYLRGVSARQDRINQFVEGSIGQTEATRAVCVGEELCGLAETKPQASILSAVFERVSQMSIKSVAGSEVEGSEQEVFADVQQMGNCRRSIEHEGLYTQRIEDGQMVRTEADQRARGITGRRKTMVMLLSN